MKKKIITLALVAGIGFSPLLMSSTLVIASNGSFENSVSENQFEDIDLDFFKNSPYYEVTIDGNEFEIVLSDENLNKLIADSSFSTPQLFSDENVPIPMGAPGVTKITGNVLSGNYKVYISKYHLNQIAKIGISGVTAALGGLPGWLVGSIIGLVTPGTFYHHGRVFVYQAYGYHYWYYQ
ncbi:hypothetical protein [Vagococcus silagei]|uniref:Uncharacterized protein n=1 Tax=Vagococcus silagei TaxID=2508885 RepID=A0A4S3B0J2_9ENTE|nr:hypothetical protein [Vagococcus silagei]THB60584.1 hypothetical protein ESZ54_09585 [Vagococcus silagei]